MTWFLVSTLVFLLVKATLSSTGAEDISYDVDSPWASHSSPLHAGAGEDVDENREDELIYSHANIITDLNAGFNGAHVSNVDGKTCNGEFWMVENITVPVGEVWNIDDVEVFAYQTFSSLESTLTGLYFSVHESDPLTSDPVIVNNTKNIMTYTNFTGIYRVGSGVRFADTDRPVMRIIGKLNTKLVAGAYYVAYAVTGTSPYGPYCPTPRIGTDTQRQYRETDGSVYTSPGLKSGFKFYRKKKSSDDKEAAAPLAAIVAPVVIGIVLIGAVAAYFVFRKKENTVYVNDTKDVEKA